MIPARKKTPEIAEATAKMELRCVRSEQCSHEIMVKLRKMGLSADDSEKIVDSLIDRRFIDDARFAIAFVRDKSRFAKWGKIKISAALREKRIPSQLISEALSQLDEEEYYQTMVSVLRSKSRFISEGNSFEGRTKLFRFGVSRGFEVPLLSKAIKTESLWNSDC